MLRAWLPAQRWFAGKGRTISRLRTVSAAELLPPGSTPGLLHLLLDVDGDCYQLLLGIRPSLPPALAPTLIGHAEDGPYAYRAVYEALGDPRLAAMLLERLRSPGYSARCASTGTRPRRSRRGSCPGRSPGSRPTLR